MQAATDRIMQFLLLFLGSISLASANLDFSRFHCVHRDESTSNLLFRSNMPIATNATGKMKAEDYGYDDIKDYVDQRAVEECDMDSPPAEFFLIEVTLNNAFDDTDGLLAVRAWHSTPDNFELGRLVEWPIGFAGLIPASLFNESQQANIAQQMFVVDQIPDRVNLLNQIMTTKYSLPAVILVHCSAGCDRTGEMIGSWRMAQGDITAAEAYNLNVAECGRPPNYYSTHAMEWYCIYLQDIEGYTGLGDCTGFAECAPFGDCQPTTTSA